MLMVVSKNLYHAAETFFLSEVCAGSPRSNLEGIVTHDAPGTGPQRSVDLGVVHGSSHDLLAAYCVLLSRLDGREDTLVMVGNRPVRFHPRADAPFDELVHDVGARVTAATPHAQYGIHFLTNEPRLRRHGLVPPALDVGFSVNDESSRLRLSLVLHLDGGGETYALTFRYLEDRLSRAVVESLAAYFLALWQDLSNRRTYPIEEARLGAGTAIRAEAVADDFRF
jgi:hypothetical protein